VLTLTALSCLLTSLWGLAELAKMIIGLEPPLLPWVADEKKVVITFLMKAHALVTATLCDDILW